MTGVQTCALPIYIFVGRGVLAHWSLASRAAAQYDYGRWIAFLAISEPEALTEPPDERLTHSRLAALCQTLDHLSAISIASVVRNLAAFARAAAPTRSWEWMAEIARRFERDFHPRDKRPRLVSAGRLARLGLDLMDCALQGQPRGCTSVALSYRDGLLITQNSALRT